MRIDLILLLASSAHLSSENCLAVAAGSEHPTTQDKATNESVDEHRATTSERSLRVHAPMDEEDEERGVGADFVKKATSRMVLGAAKPFVGEEKHAKMIIKRLFPVRSGGNWETNYAALIQGLQKTEKVDKLMKSHPDLLLDSLATRFKDPSLPLALVRMASEEGAAESVKTLSVNLMRRYVEKEMMMPRDFVDVLKMAPETKITLNRLESLDEFLKVYNNGKPQSDRFSVVGALVSSRLWKNELHVLIYLSHNSDNPGAKKLLEETFRRFENLDQLVTALNIADDNLMHKGVLKLLRTFLSFRQQEQKTLTMFKFLAQKLEPGEFVRQINKAREDPQLKRTAETFQTLLQARLVQEHH